MYLKNTTISGGSFIHISWVSLIALHKNKIQKIALFCTSNYILAFLLMGIAYLYNQESILKQIENIKEISIASLFFVIPFVGTILSSIIAYPIFYLGEILLFLLLCYQLLFKTPDA